MTSRSWLAGYCGGDNSQAGHANYATTHGFQVTAAGTWNDDYASWSSAEGGYQGFLESEKLLPQDSQHLTIIAPGLLLNTGGAQNTTALQNAANGGDLANWQAIGQQLLAGGWNSWSTIMRIGHEMNGNWEPWSTWANNAPSPTLEAQFASAFRYAVQGIRQYCPLIRYDLCFSAGYYADSSTIANTYPGDAYVDIISVDYYDGFATGNVTTGSSDFVSNMGTLTIPAIAAFAHAHGKLISVPEWGLNATATGHDNPVFIQQMFNALSAIQTQYPGIVSHDTFFDLNAGGASNWIANPNAANLYNSLWSNLVTTYTANGSGSPVVIGGLPAGNYTFNVKANNSIGSSSASAQSSVVAISAGAGGTIGTNAPPSEPLTVDFRTNTYSLDKWSVGSTISTYGGPAANIRDSSMWRAKLTTLGPLSWRIPLRWNNGNPGSSAGGAQTSGDATTWLNNIRSIGGTPYAIIGGDTTDNGESTSDVANFVHYYNDNNGSRIGGKLERLIIGNEPDNNGGGNAYIAALPGMISAAKGADPSILISAPAAAYWNTTLIGQAVGVSGVDILSYHAYDGDDSTGTGFPTTSQYNQRINSLRVMKANSIYGLEEFNWHYEYANMSQFYDWHNLCFTASVIGQTISAGGHANHYSDSNGALGLLNDGGGSGQPGNDGDPLPAFWGIGMWTGMNGQFRRFGTSMVSSSSTVTNVDCWGCNNGKIIAINKDTSAHSVTIGLGGKTTGAYTVWQTSQSQPTAAPTQVVNAATYSGSIININLPAGTVSSLELD